MPVQKYRIKKGEGCTVINNRVIELLSDHLEALGLYTYLSSLPEYWEFHKSSLRVTCRVGINKLDNLISTLVRLNLVQIIPVRNEKGQFVFFDMVVLNGFESSTMETIPMETMPMENSTYKRNINKINNKNKNSCTLDENLWSEFKQSYPRRKDVHRAKKAFLKLSKEDQQAAVIAIRKQVQSDTQYQGDVKYIPMAATYVNGRRWEDDIEKQPAQIHAPAKPNEAKCTVPWFNAAERDERWQKEKDRITTDGNNDVSYEDRSGNNAGSGSMFENKTNQVPRSGMDQGKRQDSPRSDGAKKASLFVLPR